LKFDPNDELIVLDVNMIFLQPITIHVHNINTVGKVMDKVKVAPSQIEESVGVPRAKIFCTAYTIEGNHEKIPAIRETWGQRCDGFMIPSTVCVPVLINTINLCLKGKKESTHPYITARVS